jgi:DNA-binding response OmpR family regulator
MLIENEKTKLNKLDDNLRLLMNEPFYKVGKFTFDVEHRLLTFENESTKLTSIESYLLVLFVTNNKIILKRSYILKTIWKDETFYSSRSMDVYICKLRKLLIKDPKIMIINIHGKGYNMLDFI